ncbi:MAG: glycoside hydrolase family 44 protein [Polyangiaceae bacterium]
MRRLGSTAAALLVIAGLGFGCKTLTAAPKPGSGVPEGAFKINELVYDGGLKPGWQDYGWGAHDLSHGPARIDMSNYGGWIIHHDPLSTAYGGFVFRVKAPSSFGSFLRVQLANGEGDKSFPDVEIGPDRIRPANDGWSEVYASWADVNPSSAPFDRILVHAKSSVAGDMVQFDKIGLTAPKPNAKGPLAATKAVSLTVNCREPGRAISPYIYGIAGDIWELDASTRRWGGNPTTRYNWQIHAFNTGKDWFFENQKAPEYEPFLNDNRSHGWLSALTVPIIGWVAKDATSVGFPVAAFGPQHAQDPYRKDVGDGMSPDGKPVVPGSPSQTSVPASPEMIGKWIAAIRQQDQKAGAHRVGMYILDNEPNLWNVNHRDVHPDPLTYDELLDRTIRYAGVIRAADPQAVLAGPAEWGWTGYMYSAKDTAVGVGSRPDRKAHGDVPLVPWYLNKLHEHDVATGTKSIDVLDLHYYPQNDGVYSDNADPTTAATRLRSTRSLWDPSYKDESWIKDTVRLIPRMKEWVAQNYPGLKISIGEYNFGGEKHMSGALALAEALGRFGTEGVDYAYYWFAPPKNTPAYWAFRAYRNFDGKGGKFLERSVPTKMDSNVSLFASRDQSGKHLVVIALNLDPATPAQTKVDLDGCAPIVTSHRFTYSSAAQAPSDDGTSSKPKLEALLPPYSISVFDIALK